MSEPVLDSNVSTHTARYDPCTDAILFHSEGTAYQSVPISIYIALLRDPINQTLVGISFTEFRMMILSLKMNGAIQTRSPLPLEDILCVAKRMSGPHACNEILFRELKQLIGTAVLPVEAVLEIPQYAQA